jgi:HD-like signal output (HDOD) protein
MAMSVIEQFSNTKNTIGYKVFWRHSLTAASLANVIGDLSGNPGLKPLKQELFLGGLLHDIGILIFDQFFHPEFSKIIEYVIREEKTFLFAENEVSPKENHAMIGGALLELWNMPLQVIGSVRYHHFPGKCPEKFRLLIAAIALTEYVLCNSSLGSFEGEYSNLDPFVWELTGFTPEDVGALYVKAESEAAKINVFLSIGTGNTSLLETDEIKYADMLQLRNI